MASSEDTVTCVLGPSSSLWSLNGYNIMQNMNSKINFNYKKKLISTLVSNVASDELENKRFSKTDKTFCKQQKINVKM